MPRQTLNPKPYACLQGLAYGAAAYGGEAHLNKFVLIAPGGFIALNYSKRYPEPGLEAGTARSSPGSTRRTWAVSAAPSRSVRGFAAPAVLRV